MPQSAHPPSRPDAGTGFDPALVTRVLEDAVRPGVRVYGISGLQGSGKSTLAAQLAAAARAAGLSAATLSLDDVYLDRPEREALARRAHPLLATRGPPGTHDLPLALSVLDALRAGRPVRLPRFDKLGDRRRPEAEWTPAEAVDVTILEGWCLCVPPQPDAALAQPVNALERDHDPDGRWRRWCNDALARDYPALWARVDRLLFLQPPGFDVVSAWRWQQERAMEARPPHAADPERPGMDRAALERFVQHYERVSRHALRTLPALADSRIALDARRRPLSMVPGIGGAAAAPRRPAGDGPTPRRS